MAASEQIRQHHHRCVPHLARLRMLVNDLASAPVTPRVTHETTRAANAITAEAKAACRTALTPAAAGSPAPGTQSLLQPRLARLRAAAEDAVAAASNGDAPALRQHVRRLESLTSAMWTVLLSTIAPSGSSANASTGTATGSMLSALPTALGLPARRRMPRGRQLATASTLGRDS